MLSAAARKSTTSLSFARLRAKLPPATIDGQPSFSASLRVNRSDDSNERSISNGYYWEVRRPAYVPARHRCSPCPAAAGLDDTGLCRRQGAADPHGVRPSPERDHELEQRVCAQRPGRRTY